MPKGELKQASTAGAITAFGVAGGLLIYDLVTSEGVSMLAQGFHYVAGLFGG